MESFRHQFFRTIFCISIFFIFLPEIALSKNKTLKLIKDYLGEIRTLEAKFSQTNHMGDVMTGALYIKKPGKIRFSYDPPHQLQIVSKQQAILIFDFKNRSSGPLTYPLAYTPLGYLIRNDLGALINENDESIELDDMIFLKVQNPQYQLRIDFNKNPMSIIGWEFQNQMGEIVRIILDDLRKNKYISDEIFKTEKDYERLKK